MTRVCVLGGGLGGVSMAYDLRKNLPKGTEITLVSKRDHSEFTPSNSWVAMSPASLASANAASSTPTHVVF